MQHDTRLFDKNISQNPFVIRLKPVPQQEGSEEQDATASTAPEVDAENAAAAWPPLGARISAVRLLLELDETTDMALQVFDLRKM